MTLILTLVKIMKIMMVLILNVVPIFSIENKVLAKQLVHDIFWPFFPTVWGECPVKEALCMIMMMRMMAIKNACARELRAAQSQKPKQGIGKPRKIGIGCNVQITCQQFKFKW